MGRLSESHLGAGRRELVRNEWTAIMRILERLDHADASFRHRGGHRVSRLC